MVERKVGSHPWHVSCGAIEASGTSVWTMVDCEETSMNKVTLRSIAATLEALKASVDARLDQHDTRFDQHDTRFEQVDARFEQVDRRFAQIDARFEQVDRRFEQVDRRFEAMEALVRTEGEKTRRHFDVVAEQMKAERNLVLDMGMAAWTQVDRLRASNAADHIGFEKGLADHETRLARLEKGEEP
jgi:septal ring factor EnvC (AmiA/AmiB activator)